MRCWQAGCEGWQGSATLWFTIIKRSTRPSSMRSWHATLMICASSALESCSALRCSRAVGEATKLPLRAGIELPGVAFEQLVAVVVAEPLDRFDHFDRIVEILP